MHFHSFYRSAVWGGCSHAKPRISAAGSFRSAFSPSSSRARTHTQEGLIYLYSPSPPCSILPELLPIHPPTNTTSAPLSTPSPPSAPTPAQPTHHPQCLSRTVRNPLNQPSRPRLLTKPQTPSPPPRPSTPSTPRCRPTTRAARTRSRKAAPSSPSR